LLVVVEDKTSEENRLTNPGTDRQGRRKFARVKKRRKRKNEKNLQGLKIETIFAAKRA